MKRKIILSLSLIIVLTLTGFISESYREMKGNFLSKEIKQIEHYVQFKDSLDIEVSQAPIGWHLDHMLLVINNIYKDMEKSDVNEYRNKFNFSRTMVFTFKKIPRGRGKSPDRVKPKKNVLIDSIHIHLSKAKELSLEFDSLPKKAHFQHPYFGKLNRRQAKKFLKIHTNHHLEIIEDILKN